jgi:hypothetical protein
MWTVIAKVQRPHINAVERGVSPARYTVRICSRQPDSYLSEHPQNVMLLRWWHTKADHFVGEARRMGHVGINYTY